MKLLGGDQRGRGLMACRTCSNQGGFMSFLDGSRKGWGDLEHHLVFLVGRVRG